MPRRKTKRATAASQQFSLGESLSTTQMHSPIASSSPQNKFQQKGQTELDIVLPGLIDTINQKYRDMSMKLDELHSSMIRHAEDAQLDLNRIYTSIYEKKVEGGSVRELVLAALTEKQDEPKYEKAKQDFKGKNKRRSKSEERVESFKPSSTIRRSRSRNFLDYYKLAAVTPGPYKTPKVYREALAGESVISMAGSPIFVGTDCSTQNVAQIHIPGKDGNCYAIVGDTDITDFPSIDKETLASIRKLQKFLDKLIHE